MKQRFQFGVSMIEILVTIVVVAIGALGLAAMQLNAAKYNKEAHVRSIATLLAVELADRMRANIKGVKAGSYTRNMGYSAAKATPVSAPGCGSTSDCTATTLAALDLANWLAAVGVALPQGTGAVLPVAGNGSVYSIVLMWQEKSLLDSGASDPDCTLASGVGVRCFQTTFMP